MKECWFFDNNFNGISEESLDDVMDIEFLDLPLDFDFEDNQDLVAEFKLLQDPPPLQSSHYPNASIVKSTRPTYGKTIPIQNVSLKGKDLLQFQTNSPVSVFESSSSSPSVENSNFQLPVIPAKRPRSKRQPLSNISLLYAIPFIFTSPAFQKCQRIAVSESYLQTQPDGKLLSMVKKKQTKKDIPLLVNKIEMKKSSSQESIAPRKCLHCEVTKTPQWREGPMGPKTLCNACGVRYRSGRLFAEYRPAASPTFVASVHSNSHKKVLEIRNRVTQVTYR